MKNLLKYKQLKEDFIIEDKSNLLSKQIADILVKHGVKTNFNGDSYLLGDFIRLSKRKQNEIEFIAKKLWYFLQIGKSKFVYNDLIVLRSYEAKLQEKTK